MAEKKYPPGAKRKGHSEEQILQDLRRLTEDTRKVRLELEALVQRPAPDRARSFSHDRVIARRRLPRTKR